MSQSDSRASRTAWSPVHLPDDYRLVFMTREVEEMSTAEAAESLEITEENVKTRLHHARALLRKHLFAQAGQKLITHFNCMPLAPIA